MPYIKCYEGHIHSLYEQSDHVKQVRFLKHEYETLPNDIILLECTKRNEVYSNDISINAPCDITLFISITIVLIIFYIIAKNTK